MPKATKPNFRFLQNSVFTYMVTNFLFVKIIFLCTMHTMLTKLSCSMFFLVFWLSWWWWQTLGKTYGLRYQIDYWLVTLLPLGKPRALNNMLSWCRHYVANLSAFVTEWRDTNREWSKIITEHYMKRWDRTDFITLTWQLKLKLAWHFMIGEWETVKIQLDSRVIRLLKQENFCGELALT